MKKCVIALILVGLLILQSTALADGLHLGYIKEDNSALYGEAVFQS